MVAIIDYGVGNLFSLHSSFEAVGEESCVTSDIRVLEEAERLVLPGVGAFGDAAEKLRRRGLDEVLRRQAEKGKPLLGICLGMQMLFEKSFEYGEHRGLGLIPGEIRPISETIPDGLKIPHIGWNALTFRKKSPLFRELRDGDFVYFVHSYHAVNCDESISAVTEYGGILTAAAERGNVFGCQFHPEKSGETGLRILKAFCEIK
ncbi:MAG: imidazole glycerol phosphate synthase subunit HisH [Faecousia sp.]